MAPDDFEVSNASGRVTRSQIERLMRSHVYALQAASHLYRDDLAYIRTARGGRRRSGVVFVYDALEPERPQRAFITSTLYVADIALFPHFERTMNAKTEALTRQMLEWIAARPRDYAEVMETWRTSCPRVSIWEDACADGLIDYEPGTGRVILSSAGRRLLSTPIEFAAAK